MYVLVTLSLLICGRVLHHRLGIVGSNEEVKVPQSFDDYY